jgi:elongation factor 3
MKRSQTDGALNASKPSVKKDTSISVVKTSTKGISVVKVPIDPSKLLSELESVDGMSGYLSLNESERLLKINTLFSSQDMSKHIQDLSEICREFGFMSNEGCLIVKLMTDNIEGGPNIDKGLLLLKSLITKLSTGVEPVAFLLFPRLLALHADRSASVRDNAAATCVALFTILTPYVFRTIYPHLSNAMSAEDWRIKVGALTLLKVISPRISKQISPLLPSIIPSVSDCISDSKKQGN